MKKIIEIKIKENRVVVFNDIVHVADTNVIELAGKFEYNFNSDFKDITLEIVSVNGDIAKTKTTNIIDNKFNILLDNELFKQKGTVQNTIKLIKDDKVLYINDSFKIKVKDDVEISVNSEDKVSLSQVESLIDSKITNTNNQNINLDELKETIKDIVNSTEKIDIEDIKELIDEKILAIKTLSIEEVESLINTKISEIKIPETINVENLKESIKNELNSNQSLTREEVETIVNNKINGLGGTMDNSKLDEILEAIKSTNTNTNIDKNDVASIYKLINSENKEINITLTDVATLDEVIDTKLDAIILGSNKVNITTLKKSSEILLEQLDEKVEELGVVGYDYTGSYGTTKVRRYKENNDWIVFDKWADENMLSKENLNVILENLQFNEEYKYIYIIQPGNTSSNNAIFQYLYNRNFEPIRDNNYNESNLTPTSQDDYTVMKKITSDYLYPEYKTYMKIIKNTEELKEAIKSFVLMHSIKAAEFLSELFTQNINLAEE